MSGASERAAPAWAGAAHPGGLRAGVAVLVAAALAVAAWQLGAEPGGGRLSLSLVLGASFGFVLQRSRFCFLCMWRDWADKRDPRGVIGILVALAVGIVGYTVVFGAWLPEPSGTRLPPTAHIGPVGPVLALAGFLFGAGMAISGSCLSAHLYRLGEGSPTAPFALAGAAGGFVLGFCAWNSLYLLSVSDAPVVWLPRHLGYGGALVLSLGLIGGALWWLLRHLPESVTVVRQPPLQAVFTGRWPAWAGGLAVGAIGTAAYFRVSPLGVTSEIGARAREAAAGFGLLPSRLEGLDAFRGCATVIRDALLTPNGVFVAGLVLASFAAAMAAGQFKPAWPSKGQAARGLVGGVLLGFGAMVGLGCSIGTLLSGVMAGALSGWVFAGAMVAGIGAATALGRRAGLL